MFTHATPASPTSAITNSTVVPSSPSRPSRLRGLSYLRNYTHNLHSSSHSRESATTSPTSPNSRHSLTRATSYPQPGSPTANENIRNQESPLATPTGDGDTSMTMEGPMRTFVPSGIMNPVDSGLHAAVMAATSPTTTTAAAAPVRAASQTNGVRQSESNPELRHVNVNGATPSPPPASERESKATIRFTMHQDPRAPRPSLQFSPMGRTLPTGKEIIKVGRYSERETAPNQPANLSTAAPVGFKSKVVSRRHCEFWVEDGQWYIKDVKSSSGTFLNHVRLSSPNTESKPFPVRDGDIVQLGIDFKGGEEMIFRCVKIRVEINRGWQAGLNQFNVATHKRLRNMVQSSGGDAGGNSSDCTICLAPVAPCQSLFVAPCSHTWHFKCVRRIIMGPTFPHFVCPNCRAVADLDAEVDEPTESDWEELDAAVQQSSANAAPLTQTQTQTQTQGRAPQQVQTETQAVSERFFVGSPPISPISHHISSRRNLTSTQAEEPSAAGGMHYTIEVPMINDGTGRGVIGHSEGADLFRLLTAGGDFIPPRQPPEQQTERATERAGSERTGTESGGGEPASMPIDMPPPVARGTPSPDAMQVDSLGPMTPRNDDGPFIFDGRGSVDIGTRERENWRSA